MIPKESQCSHLLCFYLLSCEGVLRQYVCALPTGDSSSILNDFKKRKKKPEVVFPGVGGRTVCASICGSSTFADLLLEMCAVKNIIIQVTKE